MKSLPFVSLLAAAACVAMPAQAEVVTQNGDMFVTRDAKVAPASLMETWLALIAPAKWWNGAHSWSGDAANMTLTPQGGGCFCERIPGEDDGDTIALDGSVQHMVVLQAFPMRALRMRGGLGPLQSEPAEGVLTITLKEEGKGTRILWEYVVGGRTRFETPVIAKAVDGVMSEQLARLVRHLSGEELDAPIAIETEEVLTGKGEASSDDESTGEGDDGEMSTSSDSEDDAPVEEMSLEDAIDAMANDDT